ncbi:ParB/RepB/Spo0J family partition protein [uncultured Microbulbifer sp.]|uniref:ParB/RepB/Spo0J family partition protein n=1 Tax=uncultured Microbulbifer sp. TaxID=348147 RepID=UPI0026359B70|nr:ParB/RepB/Spo0J family partition protein [uncultured Microbulbifer sp.]
MTQEITFIPFKNLEISPVNVRTVDPHKTKDKELIASVRLRGILQNLAVLPIDEDRFGVSSGGRRFAALTLLHNEGAISDDTLIPCIIAGSEQQARDWSLAENQGREDMHPADEFMAFHALSEDGQSIADIARNYGVAKAHVKRLLKLASVAPKLIEEFRDGKLSLDEVQAFTVTDNHEKQVAVYQQQPQRKRSARSIRVALVGGAVRSDDRLVKFVGLTAYKRAGGSVSSDLFQNVSYLDAELLESLALEKLGAIASKEFEGHGWKWVRVDMQYSHLYRGDYAGFLQPDPLTAPAKLRDELKAKESELESLLNKVDDEWTDTDDEIYETLSDKVASLEEEVKKNAVYTEADKANSGVLLLINNQGEMEPHYGIMTSEDAGARKKTETKVNDDGFEDDSPIEPMTLQHDLKSYKLQAMQAKMLSDPSLASDLLVFTLAEELLAKVQLHSLPLCVSTHADSTSKPADIEETIAATQLSAHFRKLNMSWKDYTGRSERFLDFVGQSKKDKQAILTHCVAVILKRGAAELDETLSELMKFNLKDYWKPTAKNYFNRVTSRNLLTIARKQLGDSWCKERISLKKTQLAEAMAESEDMEGWLPDFIK